MLWLAPWVWQGIVTSVAASFLLSFVLWLRLFVAAGRYLGSWNAFNIVGRKLEAMEGEPRTSICRRWSIWNPTTWLAAGELVYSGSYSDARGAGIELHGTISVDPIVTQRAIMTFSRDGSPSNEFVVQEYYFIQRDILVVPVTGNEGVVMDSRAGGKLIGRIVPEYNRHVLRRRSN